MKDLTHKKPSDSSLLLTKEEHRKNSFISSLLFSRATIFHPSSRLTNDMKNRLVEVASHGGTDPNRPLESVTMNSYGKNFRVDLHVDYLLQSHRDILEAILAFANSIVLDEESYVKGKRLTWSNIFSTITDGIPSSDQPSNEFDSIIDRDSTVLSISFYELATRMGISPTRKNYDTKKGKVISLSASDKL
ncbi:hypothetical protein [Vibrio hibernica]|uniref:hypothetical protein n=1 Tax=Vibrio hibernica TaxID=2587465 RepID=UPI00188010B7|nr:hypothetical protein [Vibrio hibernica]